MIVRLKSITFCLLTAVVASSTFAQTPSYADQKWIDEYERISNEPATKAATAKIEKEFQTPAMHARDQEHLEEAARLEESALDGWRALPESAYRTVQLRRALLIAISIYTKQERWDSVEKAAREQLSTSDNLHAGGYARTLAEACVKQKKYQEAESLARRLIADDKSTHQEESHDRVYLASIFEDQNDPTKAEKTLKDMLSDAYLSELPPAKKYAQIRSALVFYQDFLKRHSRTGEAKKIADQLADKHCPLCGSAAAVEPSSYDIALPNGESPAGCVFFPPEYPQWHCKKDDLNF